MLPALFPEARRNMSAVSSFLAPPSTFARLAARSRTRRRPRACTVTAGRPSSFPDATGFSEENKSGASMGEKSHVSAGELLAEEMQEVKAQKQQQQEQEPPQPTTAPRGEEVDGVINPGVAPVFPRTQVPISGQSSASKWLTFYTDDEDRTPYFFNQVTGETQWCVLFSPSPPLPNPNLSRHGHEPLPAASIDSPFLSVPTPYPIRREEPKRWWTGGRWFDKE